jgi:hypothetical protein
MLLVSLFSCRHQVILPSHAPSFFLSLFRSCYFTYSRKPPSLSCPFFTVCNNMLQHVSLFLAASLSCP